MARRNPIQVFRDPEWKKTWVWHCNIHTHTCGCCSAGGYESTWQEALSAALKHHQELHV